MRPEDVDPDYSKKGHERRRKQQFGLTEETYDIVLAEQGFACAICRAPFVAKPCIDHDHRKPRRQSFRGLLCRTCNVGLGMFFDDPKLLQSAIEYLASDEQA